MDASQNTVHRQENDAITIEGKVVAVTKFNAHYAQVLPPRVAEWELLKNISSVQTNPFTLELIELYESRPLLRLSPGPVVLFSPRPTGIRPANYIAASCFKPNASVDPTNAHSLFQSTNAVPGRASTGCFLGLNQNVFSEVATQYSPEGVAAILKKYQVIR